MEETHIAPMAAPGLSGAQVGHCNFYYGSQHWGARVPRTAEGCTGDGCGIGAQRGITPGKILKICFKNSASDAMSAIWPLLV